MTKPASNLLGADVFLPASRVLVSAALLAASTMMALTSGRSMPGGGQPGGVGARQVESGVQVLLLPAAPCLRSGSFSSRREAIAKIALKVEQVGGDGRRDSICTRCGGDVGIHGRHPHVGLKQ